MENLNNVPSTGTFGGSVSTINSNFDLVVNAINSLEYQTTRSKGILNYGQNPATVFPNAVAGDWCMILSEGNVFPATIKTFNGSTWSGSGTWNPDGVDLTQYAQKSEMTTAIANSLAQATARMGYGECTVSGTALTVSIPNFILPTSGGTIHIKMSAVGTGASTLSINGTTAKTLWYNGKAVSSTNTWEAGEIISVFYDGTKYMSSNSQGGGGDAEKIKYDNSQSGLAAENVQGALDEVAISAIKSYALTHFNDFIPVDCWVNKRYEGLGLYTSSGYYSWGLIGLTGGTKILIKSNNSINRAVTYRTDAYITKQQSAGDTTLRNLTPLEVSPSLFLLEVPTDRTNIGISFSGATSVSYCICGDDFTIADYIDEKDVEIQDIFDNILFPLSEEDTIEYISPSSAILIDTNTFYWINGSSKSGKRSTCVFVKVDPSSRYKIQAPSSGKRIQFIQLKDTTAVVNTYPHYAGGMMRKYQINADTSITIDTLDDCEYLYFLIHDSFNFTNPSYIKKRTSDEETLQNAFLGSERAISICDASLKMTELAPIDSNGCYINTNTWKWVANTASAYSVIYKIVGGSKVTITASASGRAQCNFLKSINANAGDNVSFASGATNRSWSIAAGTTETLDVPNDAEYLYFLMLPNNSTPILMPVSVKSALVSNGISCIDFVGDSMTQRGISVTSPRGYYPSKVMQYLGIDGYNMGVGGENAATILGRCDGIPYKLASDVTIPSGTTQVQIYLTNIYGQYLLPIIQRYTSHTVVIDGIEGTLTTTQTDLAASSANYFFQRKESGSAYNAKAGDDIFVKDFKATLNPHRAKIIWVGQNGGFDTDSTYRYGGDVTDPTDRARLIEMIKTYIAVSGCEYYMVLSAPRKTNDDLEADFAKAFGNRYFNVRMYMVNHGIDDAIALGYLSASSYPTQQDITDMNNGVVPTSLRADRIHFTENGFYTMAYALSIKLKEVWNL